LIPKEILEKISLKQSGKIHLVDFSGQEMACFYLRMGELLSELNNIEFENLLKSLNFERVNWIFAPENLPVIGLYGHSWRSFLEVKREHNKLRKYNKGALRKGADLSYQEFNWLCQFLQGCKIEMNQIKILERKGYLI